MTELASVHSSTAGCWQSPVTWCGAPGLSALCWPSVRTGIDSWWSYSITGVYDACCCPSVNRGVRSWSLYSSVWHVVAVPLSPAKVVEEVWNGKTNMIIDLLEVDLHQSQVFVLEDFVSSNIFLLVFRKYKLCLKAWEQLTVSCLHLSKMIQCVCEHFMLSTVLLSFTDCSLCTWALQTVHCTLEHYRLVLSLQNVCCGCVHYKLFCVLALHNFHYVLNALCFNAQ